MYLNSNFYSKGKGKDAISMEVASKISEKTYISVGLLISLIIAVWYVSGIAKQTDINTLDIKAQQVRISDVPTRNEFNDLKQSIQEIKTDIKKLLEAKKI